VALVGRDRELARVTGLLDDALAGRGQLVLCTGEAGIGKTRLAEELAAAAAARGRGEHRAGRPHERTAENHVQHILVKLRFSNRSQIAVWSHGSAE
jgi:predicted ATPase